MAILTIRRGYNEGKTYRLGQRTLTIGRGSGNMIQLIDDKVSRRHAMIRWDNGIYSVIDMKSHNGVLLNGAKVTNAELKAGDRLEIGATELVLTADTSQIRDAVLGPRVMDRAIVGEETSTLKESDFNFVVETDTVMASRELQFQKLLYDLVLVVTRGGQRDKSLALAKRGIVDLIGPDRLLFLQITEGSSPKTLASFFAESLPKKNRVVKPYMGALSRAITARESVRINDVPSLPSGPHPLGTVLAVPVQRDDGSVSGIVYVDSFRESLQIFIEEDLDCVQRVAKTLRGCFE